MGGGASCTVRSEVTSTHLLRSRSRSPSLVSYSAAFGAPESLLLCRVPHLESLDYLALCLQPLAKTRLVLET